MQVIQGNLITMAQEDRFHLIGHGCNCFGVMGAGIALQIAQAYPKVANSYKVHCQITPKKEDLLGNNFYAFNDALIIANMFTQFKPGANFNISAFRLCLFKLKAFIRPDKDFAIPLIGCGIGGGDKEEILQNINFFFGDNPNFYLIEYKP